MSQRTLLHARAGRPRVAVLHAAISDELTPVELIVAALNVARTLSIEGGEQGPLADAPAHIASAVKQLDGAAANAECAFERFLTIKRWAIAGRMASVPQPFPLATELRGVAVAFVALQLAWSHAWRRAIAEAETMDYATSEVLAGRADVDGAGQVIYATEA